jgi:hypothetical protein
MYKIIISLSLLFFLSAMFFFGCTADGVFDGDPREINWSKDALVACMYQGECSYRKKETCDDLPGAVLSQCPQSSSSAGTTSTSSSSRNTPSSSSSAGTPSSSSSSTPPSSSSTPSSSSLGNDPIGSCTIYGTCYSNFSQSECSYYDGTFSTAACPVPQYEKYCYIDYYEMCFPIASNCYLQSEDECIDDGGTVHNEAWCVDNGADFGFCD